MGLTQFLAGAVVGALLGVVATVIFEAPAQRGWEGLLARLRRRRQVDAVGEDMSEVGLLQINRWSSTRPLDPRRHEVVPFTGVLREQAWFPSAVWAEESAADRARHPGLVAQVVTYTVDHGEAGDESKRFDLSVVDSEYGDGVAVQRLCQRPELWEPIRERFAAEGAAKALAVAPPQSFFVAITVMTKAGESLAVRRASGAVATAGGLWSLGACETMRGLPTQPGDRPEDLFELSERALLEEVGLKRMDTDPIWFSWFGFSRSDGLMAVAHVRTHLTCEQVTQRLRDAEGAYEADGIRWIGIGSPEMRKLAQPVLRDGWVQFTPVVAQGAIRLSASLALSPTRR